MNNFIVRAAAVCAVIQQRVAWNEHSIDSFEKYNKSLLILEWFTPKEFYNLPVSVEKKS